MAELYIDYSDKKRGKYHALVQALTWMISVKNVDESIFNRKSFMFKGLVSINRNGGLDKTCDSQDIRFY